MFIDDMGYADIGPFGADDYRWSRNPRRNPDVRHRKGEVIFDTSRKALFNAEAHINAETQRTLRTAED